MYKLWNIAERYTLLIKAVYLVNTIKAKKAINYYFCTHDQKKKAINYSFPTQGKKKKKKQLITASEDAETQSRDNSNSLSIH